MTYIIGITFFVLLSAGIIIRAISRNIKKPSKEEKVDKAQTDDIYPLW